MIIMKSKLTKKILIGAIFLSVFFFLLFTISVIVDKKTDIVVKACISIISIISIIGFIIVTNTTKAKPIVLTNDFFKVSGIQQEFILRDIVQVDVYERYMSRIENIIVLKIHFRNNEKVVEIPINNYRKRDALSFLVILNNINIVNTLSIKKKRYKQNIEFTDECKFKIGVYYDFKLK